MRQLAVCFAQIAADHPVFLTLPNTSVQAEVNQERINEGGGCRLEIPVSYHFYVHEKGLNWLKNRLEAIGKTLEKDIKHCLKACILYFLFFHQMIVLQKL